MKKTYKIGELAESFGLSIDTLRLYDNMGLLPSKKRADNNYRVYDRSDFITLGEITQLKSCGMPLKQIGTIVGGGSPETSLGLKKQCLEEFQKKIDEMKHMCTALEESYFLEKTTLKNLNRISVTTSPRFIIAPCEDHVADAVKRLRNVAPGHSLVFCFIQPKSVTEAMNEEMIQTTKTIPAEEWNIQNTLLVRDFNEDINVSGHEEGIRVLPSRNCLTTGVMFIKGQDYSGQLALLDYAKKHNFKVAGDLLLIVVSLRNGADRNQDYYQLWLPIE